MSAVSVERRSIGQLSGKYDLLDTPTELLCLTPGNAVFGNTLTVADRTAAALVGNSSVPLGFESHDFGVARYAP